MLKKQQMHGVKESAPEKTCWDKNVRLKLLYDLSAFFVCFRLRIVKAVIENVNILSSNKISLF